MFGVLGVAGVDKGFRMMILGTLEGSGRVMEVEC